MLTRCQANKAGTLSSLTTPVHFLTPKNSILMGLCGVAENRGIYLRVLKEKVHFSVIAPTGSLGHLEQRLKQWRDLVLLLVSATDSRVLRDESQGWGGVGETYTSHHKANKPTGRAL